MFTSSDTNCDMSIWSKYEPASQYMASVDVRNWVFIQSPVSGRHSLCCFVAFVPMDEKWRSGAVISVCVEVDFRRKSYSIGQFVGLSQFTVHVITKTQMKRVSRDFKIANTLKCFNVLKLYLFLIKFRNQTYCTLTNIY